MALAHLSIGTATNRIDLLDRRGFHAGNWIPGAGGTDNTFTESSMSDYRRLASYRRITTIEAIPLTLKRQKQNDAIRATQELRQMLEMAKDYWAADFVQPYPVYLEARASCETNARYAIIHDGELPNDDNPFREPFLQRGRRSIMRNLVLGLERGAWTENMPGVGTAIEISAVETYDGRNLGNVDDAGAREPTIAGGSVFFTNHWKTANITDVWYWDNSAVAWSTPATVPPTGNIMDAGLPVAFMPPAPLQVGDFVLFGIQTALVDSGPFFSLVFDIGTVLGTGAGITIEWRYSSIGQDPATWLSFAALVPPGPHDNTNANGAMTGDAFDTAGIKSVHWYSPGVQFQPIAPKVGANPPLGISGYWVCAYVTAAAGNPTPPVQQNRKIYTISWPYVEIQRDQIAGDFPALIRTMLREESNLAVTDNANRMILSIRDMARGADFRTHINMADTQLPPGITTAALGGSAFVTNSQSPAGRSLAMLNTPAAWTAIARITIDPIYASQYRGNYRHFFRVHQYSGNPMRLRVAMYLGPTTLVSLIGRTREYVTQGGLMEIADFGRITIPGALIADADDTYQVNLILEAYGDGASDIQVYDLELLPIDEWAIELQSAHYYLWPRLRGDTSYYGGYADADGITFPKYATRVLTKGFLNDDLLGLNTYVGVGTDALRPGARQRLYWFCWADIGVTGSPAGYIEWAGSGRVQAQQRYFSMRGSG